MPALILVAPPWPLYDRPSIALGVLKAYLRRRLPELTVQAHHHFLSLAAALGYHTYQALSQRSWLAECVYAWLLAPTSRQEEIEALFQRQARGVPALKGASLPALAQRAQAVSERFLQAVDWGRACLVGISLSLCQLSASLYLLRRLKQLHPKLPLVVGGAMLSGQAAAALWHLAPEVDYLVVGEGERPLAALARYLAQGGDPADPPPVPGLLPREAEADQTEPWQVDELSELPPPDYRDYFALLAALGPRHAFLPTLPLEASRGCWWQARSGGCAFCNLNQQWRGYRTKPPAQVAAEVAELVQRHRVLSLAFMDNLMPLAGGRELWAALGDLDLELFAEIRATTPRQHLEAMARAGVRRVQVGVEALSSSLLARLNKGTSVMANLQVMRDCLELGIACLGNLITCFPGSTQQEVDHTLRALEFAQVFRPLRCVEFWLGRGSPACNQPAHFGLKAMCAHPYYRVLFGEEAVAEAPLPVLTWRGDRGRQRRLWQPVVRAVAAWQKQWQELMRQGEGQPPLTYRDGGRFLILRRRRPGGRVQDHRLGEPARSVYLFCTRHRSRRALAQRFPGVTAEQMDAFLRCMEAARLMFREGERWLSLALRAP